MVIRDCNLVLQSRICFQLTAHFKPLFSYLKNNAIGTTEKTFRQTQVRDRFQEIGLALAVLTKNRIDPPSEDSVGMSVVAEFLYVEFADLHIP